MTDEQRLREQKKSLAPAIAVSWNDYSVTILCPFCRKIHYHGFRHLVYVRPHDRGRYKLEYQGPSPTRNESRASPCEPDPELPNVSASYTILFPFEEDPRVAGLSFEIDREKRCFRTLGLGVISPVDRFEDPGSSDGGESPEEQNLRHAMEKLSLRKGDYLVEMDHKINEEKHRDIQPASVWITLSMFVITGDLKSLRQYVEDSPDTCTSCLLKIRSSEGESLLGLAVPNGHLEIVQYLLGQGCDVDATDIEGRTPLMEAALWAHPKIVDALLKADANKSLKDRYGMTAGHLAEETDRNDWERHDRTDWLNPNMHMWAKYIKGLPRPRSKYLEDPYIKKGHRSFIRALLEHRPTSSSSAAMWSREGHFQDAHFYKSESAKTISLVLPTEGVSIKTQAKTAAILLRGEPCPPVLAVSGWGSGPGAGESRSAPEAGFERLNEEYWAFETLNVARDMGLEFEPDRRGRDRPGYPGIFFACHAEAQLMSLFVRRNYIFPNYVEGGRDARDDFLQLFEQQPRKRAAKIIISNTPCDSCQAFKKRIQEQLGIEFRFEELQVRT